MNILIVDDIHSILLEKLDQVGISYDYQPSFNKADAENMIQQYTGLIIRSKFQVDQSFLDLASHLPFVARPGAVMDNIADEYATSTGIRHFSANDGTQDAVGAHTIVLLLVLMNNLNRSHREVCTGQWCREENRGYELKGRTVALIGYGHNGQAMAKKLSGFEVNVIAYDKYKTGFSDAYAKEVSMEEVV